MDNSEALDREVWKCGARVAGERVRWDRHYRAKCIERNEKTHESAIEITYRAQQDENILLKNPLQRFKQVRDVGDRSFPKPYCGKLVASPTGR